MATQLPYYPEFANHNSYGIKAVNDTIYDYMKSSCFMGGGCLDMLKSCKQANRTTELGRMTCRDALNFCPVGVESPY
jgi:carboxypeptidase D